MRVSIEPLSIACSRTKRREGDSVEILFAAASDMGEADRLQSDISTITDQLDDGPYDLKAGSGLHLPDHPPVGRSNWRSTPLEFTETSNIVWSLVGVGLHKAELSGGGAPSSGGSKVAMDLYKKAFKFILGKTSPQGAALAAVLDFIEAVLATGPADACLGALFAFKLEYSGADLAFNLIRAGGTIRLNLEPSDGMPFQVSNSCGRPAYSATVIIRLHDRLDFTTNTDIAKRLQGKPMALVNGLEVCQQRSPIQIWSVYRETTTTLNPTVELIVLKHVWLIDDQPLNPLGSHVSIPARVTRYDPDDTMPPSRSRRS